MIQLVKSKCPEPLSACIQLTPDIWRLKNERFYGEEVGVYLVRDEGQLILIETPSYTNANVALLESFRSNSRIFLTHGSSSTDGKKWQQKSNIPIALNELDLNHPWLRVTPTTTFAGDFQLTKHIRALHLPDHSPGHTVFFDDRQGGSLFSGDGILSHAGRIELELTAESREKILKLAFQRLLPFHYDMLLDSADRIIHPSLRSL